jgi:hypothetical protein
VGTVGCDEGTNSHVMGVTYRLALWFPVYSALWGTAAGGGRTMDFDSAISRISPLF